MNEVIVIQIERESRIQVHKRSRKRNLDKYIEGPIDGRESSDLSDEDNIVLSQPILTLR